MSYYKQGSTNEEEIKTPVIEINFSKSIEQLEKVKSKSTFRELTMLCEEIINFYKKKQEMLDGLFPIENEKHKFLFQLCQKTERLLIESLYMENKEKQTQRIKKLYNWYFEHLKKNKDLRKITERTEKDWFQEEEVEPPKPEPEKLIEIKKHRSFIGGFESAKKRLTEYNTKKISNSKKVNQISFQDENLNFYGKTFGYNTMTNFKSLKDVNIPNYIATSQQSTKYGTFYDKTRSKPEINTGSDWFSKTGLDYKKEVKESYSYIRPPYEYEFLYIENKILQQKQKDLAEKRNVEEIDKGVLEHGFKKSFYKGAVNEKNEMKEMIQKYKELLEIKRIEEERKRKEEEEKKRIEMEKLRKELEKKKEIAMSKIRQIRKPNPDRKKKKFKIVDDKEEKKEKENENKLQLNDNDDNDVNKEKETDNINDINDENNNEEMKPEANDIEELNEEEEIMKIDTNNIKYINSYMCEEDIKSTNPFMKSPELKEVKFYEINSKKKAIKLKELAIECQYNNFKEKQLELDINAENETNKTTQKVLIPSNLSSYFMFSNNIFYRRNLGRRLNTFKELDMPKNRYQESISPLSFYDNVHKKFRESPLKKERGITFTENYAMKTFYNFKDN